MRPPDIFFKKNGMPFNNMYDKTPAITPYAMLNKNTIEMSAASTEKPLTTYLYVKGMITSVRNAGTASPI
jgi:hypothetical protein